MRPRVARGPVRASANSCDSSGDAAGDDGDEAADECPAPEAEPAAAGSRGTGPLFSDAALAVRSRDVAKAVEDYRGVLAASPADPAALMYLAGWSSFLGKDDDVERYQNQLVAADHRLGADLERMLAAIRDQRTARLTEELPESDVLEGAATTIVALRPDGTMPQVLVDRLRKTLDVARADSSAPIVVTGGKPQNGVAEADAMTDWLVARGVDPARVHKEDRSASTVQNALFSASIIQSLAPSHLVVVTSANHVRRASALIRLAAQTVLEPGFTLTSVASVDGPYDEGADPAEGELRALYRDCFSVVRPGM